MPHQPTPLFFRPLLSGIRVFCKGFLPIAAFELCYKALIALLLRPFLSTILQFFLFTGGGKPAFNEEIWQFFFSPSGLLALVILAGIATVLVYFEFAVIIFLAQQVLHDESPHLTTAVSKALLSFRSLRSPGVLLFALYALVLLPLLHMGLASSLLPRFQIPNFITGELEKTWGGEALLLALAVLFFLVFFALLFVLPSMVLSQKHFGKAVRENIVTMASYGRKMLGILLAFTALWALLFLLPRMLSTQLFGIPNATFSYALGSAGTPGAMILWLLIALLGQLFLMPLLLTVLTAYYLQVRQFSSADPEAIAKMGARLDRWSEKCRAGAVKIGQYLFFSIDALHKTAFVQTHRKKLFVAFFLLLSLSLYLLTSLTYQSVLPTVIGHRGSAQGVENTLEAIGGAIEAGADFAEIDVQLSADGVPVLFHDETLERLSDEKGTVHSLTLAQLKAITLNQNGHTGKIATLQEALDYTSGRIHLAIEFKVYEGARGDLIETVMTLVERSRYQSRAILFSMDYDLVNRLATAYPRYRIGYCVYGNLGQLSAAALENLGIDYLMAEEGMFSSGLVDTCNKARVSLILWTVNQEALMEKYLREGAAGLITDHPGLAVPILKSLDFLLEQ